MFSYAAHNDLQAKWRIQKFSFSQSFKSYSSSSSHPRRMQNGDLLSSSARESEKKKKKFYTLSNHTYIRIHFILALFLSSASISSSSSHEQSVSQTKFNRQKHLKQCDYLIQNISCFTDFSCSMNEKNILTHALFEKSRSFWWRRRGDGICAAHISELMESVLFFRVT